MPRGKYMRVNPKHKPPPEPEQWQYLTCASTDEANRLGRDGWVAYAATSDNYGRTTLHMKRALK